MIYCEYFSGFFLVSLKATWRYGLPSARAKKQFLYHSCESAEEMW